MPLTPPIPAAAPAAPAPPLIPDEPAAPLLPAAAAMPLAPATPSLRPAAPVSTLPALPATPDPAAPVPAVELGVTPHAHSAKPMPLGKHWADDIRWSGQLQVAKLPGWQRSDGASRLSSVSALQLTAAISTSRTHEPVTRRK